MLALFDTGLRGAAVGPFLAIRPPAPPRGRRQAAAWLGALLALGAAAYTVCSVPDHAAHRSFWFAPILVLCTGNIVVFWLFARAVFEERCRPRAWHGMLWLAFA